MKYRKFCLVHMATFDRQKFMAQLKAHRGIEPNQILKLGMEDSEAFVAKNPKICPTESRGGRGFLVSAPSPKVATAMVS